MIRSLYVRVFVAIVGAILLATLGFALVYRTESVSDNHRRARLFLDDTLRLRGESVRARVRAGEAELVRQELVLLAERSTVRCFVFAPDGHVLGPGEPQPTSRRIAAEARRSGHHETNRSGRNHRDPQRPQDDLAPVAPAKRALGGLQRSNDLLPVRASEAVAG